ncbi:MAG TPA: M36 family metallopeptidase, partial [Candidatus Acidoferrum sp.]|nr:M36 family metallopeptidase [Candidatus Acidoferrum sp.]
MKLSKCLLLAAATLSWSLHAADLHSSTEELIGFDKRRERRAAPSIEQKAAQEKLRERVRDAKVDFDPQLGAPKWIRAENEHLTAAQGEGKAVTAKTAERFRNDPHKPVKSFIEEHRALFGHGAEALDTATKTRDYVGERNRVRTTVWHQRIENIPVYESIFAAHVDQRGELIDVSSQFVPDANGAANRGTPNRIAQVKGPKTSARKALEIAAARIGEPADEVTPLGAKPEGAEQVRSFRIKPLPGEATARLVWFPLDRDTLRLAWQVELNRRQFSERFRVLVDVQDGEVLLWRKLTVEIGAVTYRVFTNESPRPMRVGWPTPNSTQPPIVPQSLVTIDALSTNGSPLGWINDGEILLRGNNVDASLDRDFDNRADLPRVVASVDGNGHRTFDYPVNANLQPTNYSPGAAVQLFYWCNWMHDRLYEIGFTEEKGNYQKDNFGRGGVGNDPVLADAQDGSGVNNANFTPSQDGSPGRIQMYIFSGPTPNRDGDLDADVVLHEYTHGMSDRRVGHGAQITQLQTWGMAEGWSDFYAGAMQSRYEHDLDANYPMGGYASYLLGGLQESYYYGIRRYPYTTSTNVNPLTFKDIDINQASSYPGIPRNPTANGPAFEVHRQGEVWCTMLWEMRTALLRSMNVTSATYGEANDFVMQIVADGMDFTPPNPTFTQARDGIITAERQITGGTNSQIIWAAFAKRGLGWSALAPDSSTTAGIVEAYDVPVVPTFLVTPDSLMFSGPRDGNIEPALANFLVQNQSSSALQWFVSSSAPLIVMPTNGILLPHGSQVVTVFTNGMNALPYGLHTITLVFTNLANALGATRAVLVNVEPPADALDVTPESTYLIAGPPNGP